ncbi:hypothetical protein CRG98_022475 [Punica granatum]|uniref:Uncharacterized protein n=1 Tax=Punica granatum TaxID=22663 RepID=A0A2I0JLK0_PUNGR|nr:hypothetical protein CRG98_022475 [Punica granatum]
MASRPAIRWIIGAGGVGAVVSTSRSSLASTGFENPTALELVVAGDLARVVGAPAGQKLTRTHTKPFQDSFPFLFLGSLGQQQRAPAPAPPPCVLPLTGAPPNSLEWLHCHHPSYPHLPPPNTAVGVHRDMAEANCYSLEDHCCLCCI